MTGVERREKLLSMLAKSKEPIAGAEMAKRLSVSRQVIVQDIALLRAADNNIVSTNRGYVLLKPGKCERIFKVRHTAEEIEKELQIIVDNGGRILDVFVYHKVYGVVRAELNIGSRKDVSEFLDELKKGHSTLLKNITSEYHYHTVSASSAERLDFIQTELQKRGFLAKLKDYEPIDFGEGKKN